MDVITPFYEGRIEVLVFANCFADLILENDIDPKAHSKIQMLGNERHDDGSKEDGCSKHVTAPVTTRSQTAKMKEKDKSTVTDSEKKTTNNTKSTSNNMQGKSNIFGNFSKEAFKQAQDQDRSLSKLKYLADIGMSGYGYEDELLIRKFGEKINNQTSIVVPKNATFKVGS